MSLSSSSSHSSAQMARLAQKVGSCWQCPLFAQDLLQHFALLLMQALYYYHVGGCSVTVSGTDINVLILCIKIKIFHFKVIRTNKIPWMLISLWSFINLQYRTLTFSLKNSHFFSCFSLHLKCKLRSKDSLPTSRTHCIVCHFKMSSTVTDECLRVTLLNASCFPLS